MVFLSPLLLLALAGSVASLSRDGPPAGKYVVDLNPDNFDKIVTGFPPALVEFFAPWCGHCKNLVPIYEKVAEAFSHAKDKVIIARVDADAHKSLRDRYEIEGYPTIKWLGKGDPKPYGSKNDLDSLVKFVEQETGVSAKKPNVPKTAVKVLTSRNFDNIALNKKNNVLVEFYAPWCGYCKKLAPVYEQVAAAFENEPTCVVANLNADEDKSIGQKYGVTGYPTIKFFSAGNKEDPKKYEGGRTAEDFINFLNAECNTHRKLGGGLLPTAGIIPEFTAIVKKFVSLSPVSDAAKVVYEEALKIVKALMPEDTGLVGNTKSYAKYYVKVMDKIKEKEDFVEGELARLQKVIASGTIAGLKLDDFSIRQNILATFQKMKGEEESAEAHRDEL